MGLLAVGFEPTPTLSWGSMLNVAFQVSACVSILILLLFQCSSGRRLFSVHSRQGFEPRHPALDMGLLAVGFEPTPTLSWGSMLNVAFQVSACVSILILLLFQCSSGRRLFSVHSRQGFEPRHPALEPTGRLQSGGQVLLPAWLRRRPPEVFQRHLLRRGDPGEDRHQDAGIMLIVFFSYWLRCLAAPCAVKLIKLETLMTELS